VFRLRIDPSTFDTVPGMVKHWGPVNYQNTCNHTWIQHRRPGISFPLSKIQMSTTSAVISCNFLVQIFGDGVKRSQGKEGRRYNLLAAGLILVIVKTFLGPCGMEKLFIDILGGNYYNEGWRDIS
jgi:hypothetical protein